MGLIMDQEMGKEHLWRIYYDQHQAETFCGPKKLLKAAKGDGREDVTTTKFKKWLPSQVIYANHRWLRPL